MIKYIFRDISEEIVKKDDERILYLNGKSMINEFFEKLLITENIILKEEKETLLFYSLLSKKEKDIFSINSYFDSIDIAYNCYSLMSDIYINKIKYDDIFLEKWQVKYIKAIYDIHDKMIKYVEKNKIAPRYLKYYNATINKRFLSNYDKIVIINKLYTNKEEFEILNNLDIDVEYHLYIKKEDYNTEKNILEKISINKSKGNIEAIATKDEQSMMIYLTEYLATNEDLDVEINDINSKAKYNINRNFLNYNPKQFLNKSKSYKILDYLYQLENSLFTNKNKIDMKILFFSILDKDFVKLFNIDEKDISEIKKMYSSTIKYVNIDKFSKFSEIVNMSIDEVCNMLAKEYVLEKEEFLEAITEINILEDFGFKKYINNKKDMYKLILKYLDAKRIKERLDDTKYEIRKLEDKKLDKYIILNAQSNTDFSIKEYILTAKQRKDLGLLNTRDFKYVTYYEYIRKIYLANDAKILYIKNLDEDINIKSIFNLVFIENMIIPKTKEYSTKDLINHIEYIYDKKERKAIDSDFLTANDYVIPCENDFKNLSINGYNISTFMEDILSYMLVKSAKESKKLQYIKINDDSISNIVIGNIIHGIIENAIERKAKTIEELKEIKDEMLLKYKDYIQKEYYINYDYLLFTKVLDDILSYLLKNQNREDIIEKEIKTKVEDVSVSMKLDILSKVNDVYSITDIKSGTKKNSASKYDVIYYYQLQAYKVFLEYTENIDVASTYIYYPFSNNYVEKVEKCAFTINDFKDRLNTIKNLEKFEMSNNIEYDFSKIIREVK